MGSVEGGGVAQQMASAGRVPCVEQATGALIDRSEVGSLIRAPFARVEAMGAQVNDRKAA